MTEWKSVRRIVMESTLLAQRGAYGQAVRLLKDSIDKLGGSLPEELVCILLCHAATISFQVGDLKSAESYINANVDRFPNDPFSLYLMGEVLERKGESKKALVFAHRAQEEALKEGSARSEAVLELIRQRWPDLAKTSRDEPS